MKTWQKILSIVLVAILVIGAAYCLSQEQKDCCLCSSFRYHAPCLIDLETGKMIELDLYYPHPAKVAELAEEQPQMDTFSFVKLGDILGTKLTDSKIIEMDVPVSEKTASPALCRECKKQIRGVFVGRYVLADLYNKEEKILIPIDKDLSMVLRCYEITAQEAESGMLNVIIQGTLE